MSEGRNKELHRSPQESGGEKFTPIHEQGFPLPPTPGLSRATRFPNCLLFRPHQATPLL